MAIFKYDDMTLAELCERSERVINVIRTTSKNHEDFESVGDILEQIDVYVNELDGILDEIKKRVVS